MKTYQWYKPTKQDKVKYRKRGLHLHSCFKCGRQFWSKNGKVWLPRRKVYRYACRKCKEAMELL